MLLHMYHNTSTIIPINWNMFGDVSVILNEIKAKSKYSLIGQEDKIGKLYDKDRTYRTHIIRGLIEKKSVVID